MTEWRWHQKRIPYCLLRKDLAEQLIPNRVEGADVDFNSSLTCRTQFLSTLEHGRFSPMRLIMNKMTFFISMKPNITHQRNGERTRLITRLAKSTLKQMNIMNIFETSALLPHRQHISSTRTCLTPTRRQSTIQSRTPCL
jgi:hypothetical protein